MGSRLSDRTAIVTGGARGIGRHYADALAAEGAQVMIGDVLDGAQAAQDISARHGQGAATSLHVDVSDEASVKAFVDKTIERLGKIDILINNAAVFADLPPRPVTDIDVESWNKVMAVNIRGPFLMVKHVAPHMIAKRYGKIINIGSGTAHKGLANFSHYVASKGAMTSFSRALSRELGEHGICVNTLAPGFTISDGVLANVEFHEKWRQPIVQSRAIKREEIPEDLRGAIVFLSSPESDFVTGQTLSVCGGSINT
jgi:NAD(P)-dependent dehydrogenase (short-subunit alcohol dehydrogenase family)